MGERIVNVFFHLHIVTLREGGRAYRGQWISRGSGQVMYESKACSTEHKAGLLALLWLSRAVHVRRTKSAEAPTSLATTLAEAKVRTEATREHMRGMEVRRG